MNPRLQQGMIGKLSLGTGRLYIFVNPLMGQSWDFFEL